jgi:superfamily II DNA/RNA helicase
MSPQTPSFASLGAPPAIVEVLASAGIHEPFPVQAAVLPDALAGRDLLGRAPTGSGKTLAFGIPLVARMQRGSRRRPTALVLSPTRELAEQIADELKPLAATGGHRVAAVYGGVGYGHQRRALDGGASLVVACPGRLEDLLSMGALQLDDVSAVVVDEADRMADMGFLPAVRRILDLTRADRQVMLFSATLDAPVAKLTRDYQRDPSRHEVGSAEPDMTLAEHLFWTVERTARVGEAARFVAETGPTIVFTRTRHGADRLTRQLEKFGVKAAAIHGGRSQGQRTRALAAFGDGRVGALVATDVAARGIHVDGVEGVVHFDPPEDAATYVHRSGRTARAGATGVVLSLVDPADRKSTQGMQRSLGLPVGVTAVGSGRREQPASKPARAAQPAADAKQSAAAQEPKASRPSREPKAARPSREPKATKSEREPKASRPSREPKAARPVREPKASRPPKATRPAGASKAPQGSGELTGKVSNYSGRKGFGFIKVKGRDDVFVHFSAVVGEPTEVLAKGARVTFELSDGRKGPVAVNVRPLVGARS